MTFWEHYDLMNLIDKRMNNIIYEQSIVHDPHVIIAQRKTHPEIIEYISFYLKGAANELADLKKDIEKLIAIRKLLIEPLWRSDPAWSRYEN